MSQFLTNQIDMRNTPTLQVVHTMTFTEEFASTFAADLVQHIHLFADCLILFVIPIACIPYIGNQGIGQRCYTGTGAILVDREIQIFIGNISSVQFASSFGIDAMYFGQTEIGVVGRLCITWTVGTFD